MANNRNAHDGRFKYPNRPMTPGESKPEIKHLDLSNNAKPIATNFTRDLLPQDNGQQRDAPGNTIPKQQ